jgi:predicted metal-dependent enzyme (double-stranded beta helix superfamily)
MNFSSEMPEKLQALLRHWSGEAAECRDEHSRIAFFREALPVFLKDRDLIRDLLNRIRKGSDYPDIRTERMFDNEILLYLNVQPVFSVRMYLFGRNHMTPVHDHNSWGVSGSACGRLRVVRYRREDDGGIEGRADIRKASEFQLNPAEVEISRPASIHATGNGGEGATVMVSVYGRPNRRLFIQRFDPAARRVERIYPPQRRKKSLAQTVLAWMAV